MQTIHTLDALRACVKQWRSEGLTVGFVPTMGNLHNGHLTLVDEANRHCDKVVVSIFVNPMQFGANEDLDSYPRTLDADSRYLVAHNVSVLFLPSVEEIYPQGLAQQTYVEVPGITEAACGNSRPGHFRGVATVVCKLLNMVTPDDAFFGKKDYQQLKVIQAMVADLSIPVRIHGVATQRAESGLALSSRNGYLSEEQRETLAPKLYQALLSIKHDIESGNRDYSALIDHYNSALIQLGFKPDYIEILDADRLTSATLQSSELVILIAAFIGTTRLIDNLEVNLAPSV